MIITNSMIEHKEITIDRRTKIVKSENCLYIIYVMYRQILYRNLLGIRKYRWREVSHVIVETVMDNYNYRVRLEPQITYGRVLVDLLLERASKNMSERRLVTKETNLLNPKLW